MKVVLIHGKYFNSWEALGLGYIGSYLKSKVKDVEVDFYQGCFDSDETVINGSKDADFVAFSCTTPTFPYTLRIASELKKLNPKIKTIIGGYHPSAVPVECSVDIIDYIVIGEGEAALVDIIGGASDKIINGRIMEFSELPWPDRKLIKNERNIMIAYNDNKKRITSFQSHRACPFSCKYCADGFNKVLYKNVGKSPVRYRPVGDLLDEMQSVSREYRLDLMKFSDPTWNTSIEWVIEFCKDKIKRNFTVPFYPNIHAGMCTVEMFNMMAEANCYEIAIGVESGSQKILSQIGKGTTVEKIKKSVKAAKQAGILVRGYFILGMPEETEKDIKQTERLAEELELDEYGFTILCPYPGTQMYDPDKYRLVDWENADEYSNVFWHTNHLSNQRLKEWQKYLIEKFRDKLTWHNVAIGHDKTDGKFSEK